eukprot:SAG22_NODE_21_length_31784_cov_15.522897_19_plen_130_part_00
MVPSHFKQPVRSALGPYPAVHGRHEVRASFTTRSPSHEAHATPLLEDVSPGWSMHIAHSLPAPARTELLVFGAWPAGHDQHRVWSSSITGLPLVPMQGMHSTPCVLNVQPSQALQPVRSAFGSSPGWHV